MTEAKVTKKLLSDYRLNASCSPKGDGIAPENWGRAMTMGRTLSAAATFMRLMTGGALGATTLALVAAPHAAYAQAPAYSFDQPAQPMGDALRAFARASGQQITFDEAAVRGKRAPALRGRYSPGVALGRLLAGSGLEVTRGSSGVYIVRDARVFSNGAGGPDDGLENSARSQTPYAPVIVVTGTNIRGIAPDSSPSESYSRDDIVASGSTTAQDFIRTLPQNFGGGSNDTLGRGLPNDSGSAQNSQAGTFGSSVNLRGLGSGSTLVLLNGHRLAPSSGIGDFVDISMIPASAIERVEVLTDGASSIYGADAVAGVVNFVLRRDFEGLEASYRYGTDGRGSLDEHRAALAGGFNWNSGNLFVAYEYFQQSNLSAEDRSFSENTLLPNDLFPSQDRHSFFAGLSQQAGENLELFADILFSDRSSEQTSSLITGEISFRNPSTQNISISAGGSWEFATDWFADFSGTYSGAHQDVLSTGQTIIDADVEANLWAGDVNVTGPLFSLPGGDVRIATGAHYRIEDFENFDVLNREVDRQADRDVYALYGEIFVPIFGEGNAAPGLERLEINASVRHSRFSDFGSTTNPKIGILWAPTEALQFRGSYSTSFNPPPLGRVGANDLSGTVYPSALINAILGLTAPDPSIADISIITLNGTSKDLDAETSRAFTAGFDFDERWGQHSLTASGTYFDIEFENRLGTTPIPGNRFSFDAPNIAFASPELFPPGTVVFFPSQAIIADTVNSLDSAITFPGLNLTDIDVIRIDQVIRNLSSTSIRGLDFDVGYQFDTGFGAFSLGLNATYLIDFVQQAAVTTESVQQLNTQFNPVDLRFRARAGYSHDGFSAYLFANYVDDYRVDNTPNSPTIGSWTTVDLSVVYDTREQTGSVLLDNTIFRFFVSNLFDEDPPETPGFPALGILGYDATNASPRGRYISFELSKRF